MASYSTAELEAYAADPDPNAVLGEGKTEEEKREARVFGAKEEVLAWASEQVDLE